MRGERVGADGRRAISEGDMVVCQCSVWVDGGYVMFFIKQGA